MAAQNNKKEKIPFDRVRCRFECYQQTEKTDASGKKTQSFDWKPIHSYKLYLFYKKNDQFYRMPDNLAPAEPIVSIDDHRKYEIKDSDLRKCNYAFKKRATYYGYFAGKDLSEQEIEKLRNERSYVLLKMVPSDTGLLRLDHSLFQYMLLLQHFESDLSGALALTKINQVYQSNHNDLTSEIEKKLHKNEYVIITNGEIIQLSHFFKALLARYNREYPIWNKYLGETVSNALKFYESSKDESTDKLCTFENAFQKTVSEQYHKTILESHVLGSTLGNVISTHHDSFSLTDSIEDFFYKSKFPEMAKNNIEGIYISEQIPNIEKKELAAIMRAYLLPESSTKKEAGIKSITDFFHERSKRIRNRQQTHIEFRPCQPTHFATIRMRGRKIGREVNKALIEIQVIFTKTHYVGLIPIHDHVAVYMPLGKKYLYDPSGETYKKNGFDEYGAKLRDGIGDLFDGKDANISDYEKSHLEESRVTILYFLLPKVEVKKIITAITDPGPPLTRATGLSCALNVWKALYIADSFKTIGVPPESILPTMPGDLLDRLEELQKTWPY